MLCGCVCVSWYWFSMFLMFCSAILGLFCDCFMISSSAGWLRGLVLNFLMRSMSMSCVCCGVYGSSLCSILPSLVMAL